MRSHSCKFCTLTIISQKCDSGKFFCVDNWLCSTPQKQYEYVLKTYWKHVNKNSITTWYVLKASWRHLCKTSWRRFKDVFKTSRRRLEDVLKTSWRHMTKTNILILIKRLEDAFWRCMSKANMFVLIKTSRKRLEDVFWRRRRKTSSRHLEDVSIKTNVCWASGFELILGCGFIRQFDSSFAPLILWLRFRPLIHYSSCWS